MTTNPTRPAASRAELLCEIHQLPPVALLTPRQAAAYLNTTISVLGNWRSMRRGPRYHGANDFIRYRLGDLDEWVAQRAGEVHNPCVERIETGVTNNQRETAS